MSAIFLTGTAMLGQGHAATVNYSESVDGELGFLTYNFTVDTAGLNTISGSSQQNGPSFDNDSFFLTLSPGLAITKFELTFSNASQTDILFSPQFVLQELDGGTVLQNAEYSIATGLVTVFIDAPTPYAFGGYRVGLGGSWVNGSNGPNAYASFDWRTEITVGAVPLPASLPLFVSGLGALGLLGWRQKKKNAHARISQIG